jgi:hypothetical protein
MLIYLVIYYTLSFLHHIFIYFSDCMHSVNSTSDNMSSGHSLKTRAEQERISSFLHENARR